MIDFLKILIEFTAVYLFQSLLFVYGIHLFSKHPIQWKPYFLCAVLSMIATYVIRIWVTFGSHTLYSLIVLILLSIAILKIPVQTVVKSALLITIIVLILEGINILLLILIFGERFKTMLDDSFIKTISGIPSNIMLLITLAVISHLRKRKLRRKGG